jgi:hypothetical protein
MGTCSWEKLKGTGFGHDEPEIYRCIWSKSEDVDPKCVNENAIDAENSCCVVCKCTCDPIEEDTDPTYADSGDWGK